jgi:hypothetical protein
MLLVVAVPHTLDSRLAFAVKHAEPVKRPCPIS